MGTNSNAIPAAIGSSVSGVGSNSYGFSMPSGMSGGGGSPAIAGLSGIGSGMSMPTQAVGPNTYGFTMPTLGDSFGRLGDSLGAAGKGFGVPVSASPGVAGGSAAMGVRPEGFAAPIVDFIAAPGSAGGNGLLQLLQKYRAGTVG